MNALLLAAQRIHQHEGCHLLVVCLLLEERPAQIGSLATSPPLHTLAPLTIRALATFYGCVSPCLTGQFSQKLWE
jgi:hypothetical protein